MKRLAVLIMAILAFVFAVSLVAMAARTRGIRARRRRRRQGRRPRRPTGRQSAEGAAAPRPGGGQGAPVREGQRQQGAAAGVAVTRPAPTRGALAGLETDRELIGQLEKIKAIADEEKAEKTAQALERLINARKERIADLEKRVEQMRSRRGRQGEEGQGAVGEGEQRERRPREGMSEEEVQKLREERRAAHERSGSRTWSSRSSGRRGILSSRRRSNS